MQRVALNEWFEAIVQLMSRPARRLVSGIGVASTIDLDVGWLDEPTAFNRKLERAVQITLAGSGKRRRSYRVRRRGE